MYPSFSFKLFIFNFLPYLQFYKPFIYYCSLCCSSESSFSWLFVWVSFLSIRPSVSAVLPVESTSMAPLGRLACLDRHLSAWPRLRLHRWLFGGRRRTISLFCWGYFCPALSCTLPYRLPGRWPAGWPFSGGVDYAGHVDLLQHVSRHLEYRRCPGSVLGISPRFLEYLAL